MRQLSIAILLALSTLMSIFPAAAQESSTEITLSMPDPANLDPVGLTQFDLTSRDLAENLFMGLTRLNAATGQIEPALAESWNVSEDNMRWQFTLREDVQWIMFNPQTSAVEALRPITAHDVVFAVQRACDPDRPSPVTTNLYIIAGCRTVASPNSLERLPLESIGVTALDDRTVEFQLVIPAGFFLTLTSLPEFRPLPAEYVNDSLGNWIQPGRVITSGAWAVENWTPGGGMRLIPNPFWQGAREGNLSAVNIRFDIPIDNLAGEISGGRVDIARLESTTANALQVSQADLLRSSDGGTVTVLGFSFNNIDQEGAPIPSPLDNPQVRQALALGLDRGALVQAVYGNRAKPTTHLTPRSALAAPTSPGAGFDPTSAQRTLAAAGYPNCAGLGTLSLAVGDSSQNLLLAQNIVAQWQTNLGCVPETFPILQTTSAAVIESAHNTVDVLEASRFPLWIISWTSEYPDAQGWVTDLLHCEYGYLRGGRVCGGVDAIMDQAALSTDTATRFTAYNQVETEFFGSLGTFPVIPLAVSQHWWAQNPRLTHVAAYGAFQFDRWIVE